MLQYYNVVIDQEMYKMFPANLGNSELNRCRP